MGSRSAASTTGGSSPARGTARSAATKARMSASGLPAVMPRCLSTAPWLAPMPKAKRPPDSSCTMDAVCA